LTAESCEGAKKRKGAAKGHKLECKAASVTPIPNAHKGSNKLRNGSLRQVLVEERTQTKKKTK